MDLFWKSHAGLLCECVGHTSSSKVVLKGGDSCEVALRGLAWCLCSAVRVWRVRCVCWLGMCCVRACGVCACLSAMCVSCVHASVGCVPGLGRAVCRVHMTRLCVCHVVCTSAMPCV